MVKRIFSASFLVAALVLGALAFPLFAGMIDPNAFVGFQGDVPMESDEWIAYNKAMGAAAFIMAGILISYHIIALLKLRDLSTTAYIGRSMLVAVFSLIPACITMLLLI